jgi:hypothetical protein
MDYEKSLPHPRIYIGMEAGSVELLFQCASPKEDTEK